MEVHRLTQNSDVQMDQVLSALEKDPLLAARVLKVASSPVYGGQLVQSFLREGLVTDMVITTVPVLIGGGRPLFGALPNDIDLKLVSSRAFPSGLVQSTYLVAP